MNDNRRTRNICCLFVGVFLFFGCSTSPEDNTSGEVSSQDSSYYVPKNAASAAVKKKARVDTVMITDMKFQPERLNAQIGDTVIWINNDLVTHCVTEEKNKAWTSYQIPAGGSWKMKVKESDDYYCAIHQVMKGKIITEESKASF